MALARDWKVEAAVRLPDGSVRLDLEGFEDGGKRALGRVIVLAAPPALEDALPGVVLTVRGMSVSVAGEVWADRVGADRLRLVRRR